MKFVSFGNLSVRADRIVAINRWLDQKCIIVHCGPQEEYRQYFKTPQDTREAHEKLMEELSKIGD
jgi:sugar phosphate isomerase/epimerase